MKPRLIVLIVAAAGLAVAFAVRSASPPVTDTPDGEPKPDLLPDQLMVRDYELLGEEPDEEAEFDTIVRVDTSTGKNRLVLEITEKHGYYTETIFVDIWHTGEGVSDPLDSALLVTHRMNRYMKANETFVECLEIVPAELAEIGGSIGTDADWAAEVTYYDRARAENPASFPPVGGTNYCGD